LKGQTRPFTSTEGTQKTTGIFKFDTTYQVKFQEK
jgi:hypothetical protein